MKIIYRLIVVLFLFTKSGALVWAATLSHSGTEVNYEYEVEFRAVGSSQNISSRDALHWARLHADHLDAIFHMPEYANHFLKSHDYDPDLLEGFGGTKKPAITILRQKGNLIRYKAKGTAIVLKKVATEWIRQKKITLPLLQDFSAIYTQDPEVFQDSAYKDKKWLKCTDDHYTGVFDFSYFYNYFRKGCEELGKAPIAVNTTFTITPTSTVTDSPIPKSKLFGDNENGRLVTYYYVNGLSEKYQDSATPDATLKKDDGYLDFIKIRKTYIEELGFTNIENQKAYDTIFNHEPHQLDLSGNPISLTHFSQRRFFETYIKDEGGKLYVVRNALFYSENEVSSKPLRSFPKFWKEAWENGDVIYYGGHSGDGVSLSRESMLENLQAIDIGKIKYKRNKEQVIFFDSCSSYVYYVEPYKSPKPKTTSIMTYGVVSLFPLALPTLEAFIKEFHSQSDITWIQFLSNIEKAQLKPMIDSIYYRQDRESQLSSHIRKGQYPSYLLSVSIP